MTVLGIAPPLRPWTEGDWAAGTTGPVTRERLGQSPRPGCLSQAAAGGSGPTLWNTLRLAWSDPQTTRDPRAGAGASAP